MKISFFTISFVFLFFIGYSQKGPGGVSYDSDNQKNCRLWLDAADLTHLADEDSVLKWYDKSVSLVRDSAFWDSNDHKIYRPPVFRNAPSAGINGKPAIVFNGASMLTVGTWNGNNGDGEPSVDLNSNPGMLTTYEQTIFLVFRTSSNITDRQILWEEGGSNRGFNILIVDGNIQIGAYDDTVDPDNGSTGSSNRVPKFGYTYKRMAIQPNTTYVLSYVYNVPKIAHGNVLITNTLNPAPHLYTGMTGTLNGQSFPVQMLTGGQHNLGVGGVFTHPDPIGIGGLKRTSYDEDGRKTGSKVNGTRLYEGKLAEICYYAFAMNTTQRIIVENYLAAKYFANVIENDKFEYKSEYGYGVIGIGKEQPGDSHDISQGDNIFEIKATNFATAFPNGPPSYVLTGHNNRTLSWTTSNTPDSTSIQRLRRTWRWNVTGVAPTVKKKIRITLRPDDMAQLPPLPDGFSKYGILTGDGSQVEPNFGSDYEVIELIPTGTGTYYVDVDIKKGTYFTFCAIKPTVQFRVSSDFTIEGDVGQQNKVAEVYLNYKPAPTTTFTVHFTFLDGTALRGPDYQWNELTSPLTFSASVTSRFIPFQIINDIIQDDPAVKTFTIALTGASTGLTIGERYELVYTIFDNDPPPKAGFAESEYYFGEGDGQIQIPVQIFGTLTGNANVKVRYVAGSGTATRNVDFTVNSPQTLSFTPSTTTAYFTVNLIDDVLHEDDEFFEIEIFGASGVGFGPPLFTKTKIYIQDNDNPPTVSFVVPESEGYRIISDPQIQVHLSAPSAKQVLVPYTIIGGTAINEATSSNGDYSAAPEGGTLVFNPGDTVKVLYQNANNDIGIHVYATGSTAIDDIYRTIIFELADNPTNATAGTLLNHIYTIKDYTEFEWQGLAGIGKRNDNTIWMAPDAATSGNNIESIPNLSPRNVFVYSDVANRKPTVTTPENGRNNHKMISFNGTSHHLKVGGVTSKDEGRSGLVNEGPFFDNKSIFFVFSPEDVTNTTTPQIIYEQGGGERGMSIYMLGNKLYFMAWISKDDGEYSPWGLNNADAGASLFPGTAYIESTTSLVAGEYYVVSCHYGRRWGFTPETEPPYAGLHMYINGKKEASYPKPAPGSNQNDIGRLYKHGGRASIGSAWHQTKVHDRNDHGPKNTNQMAWFFKGKIGEFLYYNEPIMNPARAKILHNYLSAMYNIPLVAEAQVFDLSFSDNTPLAANEAFNHQLAGIGKKGDFIHGDSQGSSELRIRNAFFNPAINEAFLVWGNNGEALTNTWPASAAHLPPGIIERSGKVWKLSSKPANGIQSVDISIKYNNVQNASAFSADEGILKLLVSNHPSNFSHATVYNVSNIESGYIAKFANVSITDGMYIALANTSPVYPLPVELLDFSARLENDVVNINWSTASEHNNDYFVVERSGEDLKWKEIGQIPGAGNSNTRLYYSEKDHQPLTGISYYRLKQVDFDGSYKYSDVVSVINRAVHTTRDDMLVYPNPSSQSKVYIQVPQHVLNLSGNVAIYNLSGTKVYQTSSPENTSVIEVNCGDLPSGIYLIEFRNPEFYGIKKWIINK